MHLRGYMIEVTLDDDALTVEGTNKASRIALRGQHHGDGPVVVPRADIASVEHKGANPMVNGKVTVNTHAGEKYQLHFRRKSRDEFAGLFAQLNECPN